MARWMSSSDTYKEPTSLRKALDKGGPCMGALHSMVCESMRRMIKHGSEGYTRVGVEIVRLETTVVFQLQIDGY